MGVIHKLKKEVVDFITEQKQANPQLSCRKLAELIQDKFFIKVSKSSVNAVIKEENLSSPVGRRPKKGRKTPKFTIPNHKKEQLLEENKDLLIDYKDESHPPQVKVDLSIEELKQEPEAIELPLCESIIEEMSTQELNNQEPIILPGIPEEETKLVQEEEVKEKEMFVGKEEILSKLDEEKEETANARGSEEATQAGEPEEREPEERKEPVIEEAQGSIPEEAQGPTPVEQEEQEEEIEAIPKEQDISEKPTIEPQTEPQEIKPQEESIFEDPFSKEEEIIKLKQEEFKRDIAKDQPEQEEEIQQEAIAESEKESLDEKMSEEERPSLLPDPLEQIPQDTIQEKVQQEEVLKEAQPEQEEPAREKPLELIEQAPAKEQIPKEEAPKEPPDFLKEQKQKEIEPPPEPKEAEQEEPMEEVPVKEEPQKIIFESKEPIAEPQVKESQEDQAVQKQKEELISPEELTKEQAEPQQPQEVMKIRLSDPLIPQVIPQEEKVLYDGMGCFFLKAAEWELAHSSILGGLLSKYTNLPLAEMSMASEVFLYFRAFGIEKIEDLKEYHQKGLWKLNGIEQDLSEKLLKRAIEAGHAAKNLPIAMSNEYSQIFSEISYVKLSLEDSTALCIDTQLKSIWFEDNVQPVFPSALNKTLSILSENFISNVQPLIILSVPGMKNFSRQFFDLAAAFNNVTGKKITKISIFDGNKEEIAKFSSIPQKKRQFIIGAWPWQAECKNFIEQDIRSIDSFYHEGLGREIYYSYLKTQLDIPMIGQKINVRVALIREKGLDWPEIAIITNIFDQEMSIVDIISAYLLKWPNLKESYDDFSMKTEKATYGAVTMIPSHSNVSLLKEEGHYNLLDGKIDFWTNIEFLLSGLNSYCQRHYFPPHYEKLDFMTIKERFYGLSGFVERKDGLLIVKLDLPQHYPYMQDLEYSLRRLNESGIKNFNCQKLIVRLDSKYKDL
ncbi:MAG: hypothetical protein ABIJ41_03915 [Candidatus Omnitrophota bacterium]